MKRVVTLLTVLLMAALTPVCLLGCSQTDEAPAADPGTAGGLSDALQDIGGDAGDAMEEAADDMGDAIEDAGDAVEETVEDATE